tara:strand:+ start:3909 stop:5306 length:1398 start_codon:yes stop_codon:yes gene_type:complete
MSALANTDTHHANVDSVQLSSEPAVTSISVTARIDYIQRFSKQAVLVIDQEIEIYTQAARQFLISLSKEKSDHETNVAFVSASTKLNDIQMRCRLVEQLFANTLFDPEKSLAVSILQLSKQSKDSITIIVEHAHALSLQIKYELCQLVDVANKTHNKINVVLFGKEQAAQEIATNKSIFNNKLAIIDAKSGQLFALDHTKFNNENTIFTRNFWWKLLLITTLVCTLIGSIWYALIKFDNFTLSELPLFNRVETKQPEFKNSPELNTALMISETVEQASAKDIQAALSGNVTLSENSKDKPAKARDILQALALDENIEPKLLVSEQAVSGLELPLTKNAIAEQVKPENTEDRQVKSQQAGKLETTNSSITLTPNYYLNKSTGYAVQIVGFSDMTLLTRFIETYPNLEYFTYPKSLNEQLFVVITTKVYDSQEQASIALEKLPRAIIDKGVWIKALSIIKNEIIAND